MVAPILSRYRSGLVAGVLALALPASAATVSTSWVSLTSNNQEECLAIGLAAVQALGFRGSVSGDRQAVFGWRNDETLTVRCIATHELAVVFAYTHDRNADSGPLVERVGAFYRARAAEAARAAEEQRWLSLQQQSQRDGDGRRARR
ncbi:hypothetical protein [Caldovatus aquaticus]|uniref:Uncharacterized protein n=1 Tax=Caldovatus aquaticus TaxID=2865671 RepID=A0ABS7F021_9PROT|nr:hypothetical protein [Caldovatus aquaticus]MBW8268953.1 hypothetical protein [Caldovatus aquaticus]